MCLKFAVDVLTLPFPVEKLKFTRSFHEIWTKSALGISVYVFYVNYNLHNNNKNKTQTKQYRVQQSGADLEHVKT